MSSPPRSEPGSPVSDTKEADGLEAWNGLLLSGPPEGLESVWDYVPGGHHPVHLGDHLGPDGRYHVLHKLGNGGFANVWLSRDVQSSSTKYVAIKIIVADELKDECREVNILKLFQDMNLDLEEGGKYICSPLDQFDLEGPSGSHICLVYPVLGPRAFCVAGLFDDPAGAQRRLCHQVVQAIATLHAHGICHGDLTSSNVLIRTTGLDDLTEHEIIHEFGEPDKVDVITESENPATVPTAPKYLVRPVDFDKVHERFMTDQACVIDFGESFLTANPPEDLGTPEAYRSPELIFDKRPGEGSDIWALGCTLFEIRTGRRLFEPFDNDIDEQIHQIVILFGPLPEPWWSTTWERRKQTFEDVPDAEGRAVKTPQLAEMDVFEYRSIREAIAGKFPSDHPMFGDENRQEMAEDEVDLFTDLLEKIFRYNPSDRPTALEILQHAWFNM